MATPGPFARADAISFVAGIYEETLQKSVDGEALLLGFQRDEGFGFR